MQGNDEGEMEEETEQPKQEEETELREDNPLQNPLGEDDWPKFWLIHPLAMDFSMGCLRATMFLPPPP